MTPFNDGRHFRPAAASRGENGMRHLNLLEVEKVASNFGIARKMTDGSVGLRGCGRFSAFSASRSRRDIAATSFLD